MSKPIPSSLATTEPPRNYKRFFLFYVVVSLMMISALLGYNFARADSTKEDPKPASRAHSPEQTSEREDFAVLQKTANVDEPPELTVLIPQFAFAECGKRLTYTNQPSSNYNPNNPWRNSFIKSNQGSLQDLNGDNLPDYLYSTSQFLAGYVWTHSGCVYLNNGNGWTVAYECYARTEVDLATGQTVSGEYYGDCAAPD